MTGDAHGKCERFAPEYNQKQSEKHSKKGVQNQERMKVNPLQLGGEKEKVSSSYHRRKGRKPISVKDTHQQEQRKKLDYQTKATLKRK